MSDRTQHPLALALPTVGLPLTICVLTYGSNAGLAARFLTSLYSNTDPRLFILRAGLNAAEPATHTLLLDYAERFGNVSLFVESKNVFKYPMMRRMFYSPPIPTPWSIWCDDDTHFIRPDWLQRLSLKLAASPEVALWGKPYVLFRKDRFIVDWIKAASWYRGLALQRGKDQSGAVAAKFLFATGGFWAIRSDTLRSLDWPDPRLVHTTGDFTLGEALRQNGLMTARFDYGLMINDAPRRNAETAAALQMRIEQGD